MYTRKSYVDKILQYQNMPLIKVITGMRRVGKSIILQQVIEAIKKKQPDARITYINKEDFAFEKIKTASDLDQAISSNTQYLFLDEVQEIDQWEKIVVSYLAKGNIDIYISGSNAHLLSSELATLISGRYIELPVYPLCLAEFMALQKDNPLVNSFEQYLQYGGMPVLHHMEFSNEIILPYLNSLWNTILLKDIVTRYEIRNVELLQRIAVFVFDNIGHIITAKSIADYLKSQRLKVGVETIQNYLQYLTSTYVLNKVQRYDIRGKRNLEIYEKYFLGDIGLRHALLGDKELEISGTLENIVFLELKRRGYQVSIGKIDELEIDFIATKENQKIYIQVTYLLATPEVISRELSPFYKIKDNYPKWLISLDRHLGTNFEGIKSWYMPDFLLSSEY